MLGQLVYPGKKHQVCLSLSLDIVTYVKTVKVDISQASIDITAAQKNKFVKKWHLFASKDSYY